MTNHIKCIYSLALFTMFTVWSFIATGQGWKSTQISQLSQPVSNNAVCGGEVNGVKMGYSFCGIDSTKKPAGIHLKSFKVNLETGATWQLPDVPDTLGKIAASASFVSGKIYLIGGYHVYTSGREASSNKVHIFDTETEQFLNDGTPIPIPIDDHVQLVKDDRYIYVITGWSDVKNVPDVQVYDTKTDSWEVATPTPNNSFYTSFGASGSLVGDTIYYFGGASSSFGFKPQSFLRKGVINPLNHAQITWTHSTIDPNMNCYRCGSFTIDKEVFWIGGSRDTYNYNGLSYNNNRGVEPAEMLISLKENDVEFTKIFQVQVPMDIRGVIQFGDDVYTMGGMMTKQLVTDAIFHIHKKEGVVGVESKEINTVLLFPNPVNGTLKYNVKEELTSVTLIGPDGKRFKLNHRSNANHSDISHLSPGIYMAILNFVNQQPVVQKIAVVNR